MDRHQYSNNKNSSSNNHKITATTTETIVRTTTTILNSETAPSPNQIGHQSFEQVRFAATTARVHFVTV
jgi:hypothetical protein